MLVCPKCSNQQESGKFCGVCGTAVKPVVMEDLSVGSNHAEEVSENNTENIQQDVVNPTPNESVQPTAEAIKSGLSQYWSYFLSLIKNPSRGFQVNENNFVNGLVTLGLYALLFSLSLYFLANSLVTTFSGGYLDGVPFFAVVSRLVFLMIIFFVITFGSAFVMIKIAKNQDSFQTIIAQYGSIIVPFTALNVIAMLGGLIGSAQLTGVMLLLSLAFTFTFTPVLFVYEKVSILNKNGQKIYLSLATIILISLICLILGDALIVNLIDNIDDIIPSIW